jgi:hypothetical protein
MSMGSDAEVRRVLACRLSSQSRRFFKVLRSLKKPEYRRHISHWAVSVTTKMRKDAYDLLMMHTFCGSLGYSSTQYSVGRDIPVQHIQSVGIF